MFTAALFTIAKTWKQPRCLSIEDGQRRCGAHIQWNATQPLKMNEIMSFIVTRMQLEIIILGEVSHKEKDKYHMISLTYGI